MKSNVISLVSAVITGAGLALSASAQPGTSPERVRLLLADSRRALERDAALEYDPYTVLVRFAPGTSEEIRVFARAFAGGRFVRSFNIVSGLEQLRIDGGIADAVDALLMIPGVEFAEPDYVVQAADAVAGPATGGAGVVADLDTGVNYTLPALAGSVWTNPGEVAGNGIDDDANGYVDDVHGYDFFNHDPDPMDDNGQGTQRAASRAGSPRSETMALKVLGAGGRGQVSDAVSALDYAATMGIAPSLRSWKGGDSSAAMKAALERSQENAHLGAGPSNQPPVLALRGVKSIAVHNRTAQARTSGLGGGRERAGDGELIARARNSAGGSPGRGNSGDADGGERGGWVASASAQDLDISLGFVSDPAERFIPTIATWRYVQPAVDRWGEGRGVQVAGLGPHEGKVANGDNSVWFGVDFIADRADRQQFIGGEVAADGGCVAYIDAPAASPGEADLCFAVIVGNSYSVCRLAGVVRPGVRVSFQACYRLHQGDWQLNPFHGPPGSSDPPRITRASIPLLGDSLRPFTSSVITAMYHGGQFPSAMASTPDLLSDGAQDAFILHGSFTGKLFAFEYHPTSYNPRVADFPQPTRAKVSLTFRGLGEDATITNRGTAREDRSTTLVGPPSNRMSSGTWLPPSRTALSGDLAAVGAWLRHLDAGDRCVAIVLGDSNSAAAEGGVVDALIQSVMTYFGGLGYDARPDVYWSATMNDNHALRQYAGLGGRASYGGDVSDNPDDIPIVSGSGGTLIYPFPLPQAPFTATEWIRYAAEGVHVQRPGANSIGLLSAFCTSDTSDTAKWRLPNFYSVQNTADGAMNDSRGGHARLAGSGLLYARSRLKAGDLVCVEAVLGQRETNPGGSIQFALRAQDGLEIALPDGGRLVTATGGLSGAGWMTVDSQLYTIDAQREQEARAYTGYPGQPMRPATMNVWSPPAAPMSGIGQRSFTRVRSEPWVMGEIITPGAGAAIAPFPVSYQPHVLLKRRTICSLFGVRIIRNVLPGEDHARLPWTVAMMGVGGSRAVDQMFWLFSDPTNRVLREQYWQSVMDGLNVSGAHVLFVHVESQNSAGQATGVPEDAINDNSSTWAGYTGAKIRALQTLAGRAGAASACTIALNSPRLTSDNALPRGEVLSGIAPLIDNCVAVDLFQAIGQRQTQDSLWALHPYLAGDWDYAHPHYTVLGPILFGSAFSAGLDADAAAGGR